MAYENVVLVDLNDQMLGTMEKMAAHRCGKLHRAISVFVINSRGEVLLQQRARGKYHSAGKWSNTCCSHPRPGEDTVIAAARRLQEEMGLQCELTHAFTFDYQVVLENGLSEFELDHVYLGTTDRLPVPDPAEVASYAYRSPELISESLEKRPEEYTEWFKICFHRVWNLLDRRSL